MKSSATPPVICVTAVLAATTLVPTQVYACLPDAGIYSGQPAMDATDVPTDVVPWVQGQFSNQATFQMEDANGTAVPVDVRGLVGDAFIDFAEVHPRAVLAPRTRYLVRGALDAPSFATTMLAFTTGDGPLVDAAPVAPTVQMQFGVVPGPQPACGPQLAVCVATDSAGTFETTVRRSDGSIEAQLIRDGGPHVRDAIWGASATPLGVFCVEVRRRDLAGRLSPPATVCSDAMAPFTVGYDVSCDGARMIDGGGYLDERAGADGGTDGSGADSGAPGTDASPADGGPADSGASGGRGGCSVTTLRPTSDRRVHAVAFAVVAGLGIVMRRHRRKRHRVFRAVRKSTTTTTTTTLEDSRLTLPSPSAERGRG